MIQRKSLIPDDGYTEPGYIKPNPGIHGEFRFHFRPMRVTEQSEMRDASSKLTGPAYERMSAAAVAQQVTAWELPEEITPENVLRLKPQLFLRLHLIVAGFEATDIDPLWSEEKQQGAAEGEYLASLMETTPGAAREIEDAKNSAVG